MSFLLSDEDKILCSDIIRYLDHCGELERLSELEFEEKCARYYKESRNFSLSITECFHSKFLYPIFFLVLYLL